MHDTLHVQRCLKLVKELAASEQWDVSPAQLASYAQRIAVYLSERPALTDRELSAMLSNYHRDHDLIEALQNPEHVAHVRSWQYWIRNTLRMLIADNAGNRLLLESAVGFEDLAQEALVDVWRGLPKFRYQSRFSTWMFAVVGHCLARYYRAAQAQKRTAIALSQSLEGMQEQGALPQDAAAPPDAVALSAALAQLVEQVLAGQADPRLGLIFRLWLEEDLPLRIIGERLHLSVTRVHVLLNQALTALRNNASLQSWHDQSFDESTETIARYR